MKTAKEIALLGVFVGLLIGCQLALSAVQGIEIVTILLSSFCYYFGAKRGVIVATAFSLLRCFVFGFFVNIVILYLVYYNLLAVVFGVIGKLTNKTLNIKRLVITVLVAVVLTVIFTALDVLITALFYGFSITATKVYFMAGVPTLITQLICVAVSVAVLFYPLVKIYKTIKIPVES